MFSDHLRIARRRAACGRGVCPSTTLMTADGDPASGERFGLGLFIGPWARWSLGRKEPSPVRLGELRRPSTSAGPCQAWACACTVVKVILGDSQPGDVRWAEGGQSTTAPSRHPTRFQHGRVRCYCILARNRGTQRQRPLRSGDPPLEDIDRSGSPDLGPSVPRNLAARNGELCAILCGGDEQEQKD
jgi:hypothetical protein